MEFEKSFESYLKKETESRGGVCLKLSGIVGLPDRLVLLPDSVVAFVEMKRPGERPRKAQFAWLERLRSLGFVAGWCDSYSSVDRFFALLEGSEKK